MNGIHLLNEYNSALDGVGANTGLTQEELMSAFEGSNRHLTNFIKTTDKGNLTWKNYAKYMLKAKASTIGMRVATVALNTAITMVGTAIAQWIIGKAVERLDRLVNAADYAREKLENLKSEYDDNASKLNELNSELETTRLRMYELLNMGSLTYVEQEELNKLRQSGNELEREISLLTERNGLLKEQKELSFVETAENSFDSQFGKLEGLSGLEKFSYFISPYKTIEDVINNQIDIYNTRQRLYESNKNAYYKYSGSDEYYKSSLKSAMDGYKEDADNAKTYLLNRATQLQSDISGITYGTNEVVNGWLDKYNNAIDSIYIALGGDDAKENAFSTRINQMFDEVTDEFEEFGKEGKVTAKMIEDAYGEGDGVLGDFIDNLVEIGYISGTTSTDLSQVARAFNSLGDEASNSADEIEDAFRRWEDAQNAVQSGAQFDKVLEAYNHLYDTVADKKSDLYGRIGNEDYKAAFGLLVPDTIGTDPSDSGVAKKYLDGTKRFFTYDDDGNYAGLNITKFLQEARDAGLMEYFEDTDMWMIKGQQSLETFAKELELTVPVVKAMFGEMNEFGGDFQFYETDDSLLSLAQNAKSAADALDEAFGDKELGIKIDIAEIENTEDKIKVLEETISNAWKIINNPETDTTQANNARKIIEYCIRQKQELEKPAVMHVDTTQIEDEKLASAIQKIQDYVSAQYSIELYSELKMPIPEEIQKAYDSAIEALNDSEYLASIGFKIDEDSEKSVSDQIDEFIKKNFSKNELTTTFGLDENVFQPAIDALETITTKLAEIFDGERKLTFKPVWNGDTLEFQVNTEPINEAQAGLEGLNEQADKTEDTRTMNIETSNDTKKSYNIVSDILDILFKIIGRKWKADVTTPTTPSTSSSSVGNSSGGTTQQYGGSVNSGGSSGGRLTMASGTAHHGGTAFNGGDWRAPRTEDALGGELGTEILVRNGRWRTIGENGAEFFNVKKGDIIFNHKQTEALLKHGYITGRGRAFAGGTAYPIGTASGGISGGDAWKSQVSGGNSTYNYGKSKSSSKDDSKESIDYIEILLDRLSRALEKFANTADDTSKSFATRTKAIDSEIKKTDELIKANEKAKSTYLSKANSVKLSSSLKQKVREGAYDISDYDSDTAELINKYKELYDKYLDAADEISTQKINKAALQMEKFDLVQQKYDSKFDLQDAKTSYYENLDEQAELDGKGGSIKAQNSMIALQERRKKLLEQERDELEAMFNSGTIKKGTEDWYAMQTAIREVKADIVATDNEIANLENRKIEIQYDRFENISDGYNNRLTLKDNRISLQEAKNEQAELEGKGGSITAQKKIISLHKERVDLLEQQREELRKQLKNIPKETDEWYKAKAEIQEINTELANTNNEIEKAKDNIDDIKWERFESIADGYKGAHSETDARIAYYEDSNTRHELLGNQGSVYAQEKMIEWNAKYIENLKNQEADMRKGLKSFSKDSPQYLDGLEELRQLLDTIRDAENQQIQYENNKMDILFSRYQDIVTLYDSKMSNLDSKMSKITAEISQIEANGYKVSAKFYEEQRAIEENRVSVLNRQLGEMQEAFSSAMETGNIKKHSQEWYDWQLEINNVEQSIRDAETAIVDFDKALRDLEWEEFEYARDLISKLNDEADFYIDLMSDNDMFDDNGNITNEGMATLGLHAQKYNVYMEEAAANGEKLAEVEAKLANDPNNTELIEKKHELADAMYDNVLAAQDEKQAIRDLVEDGINYELEALQKLIDEYTEALDRAKDLHDYEKKVADQTSEISSIRKQISAYSGDDSQEAKLKIQQLQADLKEAEENLEETEYDKYISDQKELLDDFYTEYETILNARLDDLDALINGVTASINKNSKTINDTLNGLASDFGIKLSTEMKNIWGTDTFGSVLNSYLGDGGYISDGQSAIINVLNDIENEVKRIYNHSSINSSDSSNNSSGSTSTENQGNTPSVGSGYEINDKIAVDGDGKITAYMSPDETSVRYQLDTNRGDYYVKRVNGDWIGIADDGDGLGIVNWVKSDNKKISKYKNGGLVDYTGLAWVDGSKSKPEYMLNADDTANFLKLREDLGKLYSSGVLGNISSIRGDSEIFDGVSKALGEVTNSLVSKTTSMGDINVTIPIERVQDYNDFVTQLKNDPKFGKLVKSMSIDLLGGKSPLAKNRLNW